MFSQSYYAKLDPSYRQALQKLENDLSKTDNELNVVLCSQIIHEKNKENRIYLLPTIIYHCSYCDEMKLDLSNKGIVIRKPFKRMLMNKSRQTEIYFEKEIKVEELCFPHSMLEFFLYSYENCFDNSTHLPKKIIKRNYAMRKLYEKIKAVEDDDDEWINAMIEADDTELVKHNIEYKLGQDLTNKKLWILYIEFLKKYDVQELLQTYSKYCRFFVDDIVMKEEYKKAAGTNGKVTVPWKDVFDFEIYDKNLLNVDCHERATSRKLKTPPTCYFDDTVVASQNFPFHSSLMDYIVKNAEADELQKLNFSCKYYFYKYRIPVCYFLLMIFSPLTQQQKFNLVPQIFSKEIFMFIWHSAEGMKVKNLYISTKFYQNHSKIPLCEMIPKIYRCDAKFIRISDQKLTINELKFFIGHGKVIKLSLSECTITGSNGEHLFLEDILALTPILQYLAAFNTLCSTNTFQNLCDLPFKNKFMSILIMKGTNIVLDPKTLGEFINKHASPDCKITIDGAEDDFAAIVNAIIDSYWKTLPKPLFIQHHS